MLIKKIVKCEHVAEKCETSVAEKFEVSDGDDVNNLIFIFCRKKRKFFRSTIEKKVEFNWLFPQKPAASVRCECGMFWRRRSHPNTSRQSSVAELFFFPQGLDAHNILWLNFVNHERAELKQNFISVQWAETQSLHTENVNVENLKHLNRSEEMITRDSNYCFIIISSCSVNHS